MATLVDFTPGEPMAPTRAGIAPRLATAIVATTTALTALLVWLVSLARVSVMTRSHDSTLRDALTQWDAGWLTLIAEHGYTGFTVGSDSDEPTIHQAAAFFPGYPILVRTVSSPLAVFGVADAILIAALLVSVVASMVLAWGAATLALEIWARATRRPSGQYELVVISAVSTVIVLGAPMGIVYWMPYSEAAFGALVVWSLVAMIRGRYTVAGVLALAAGLTRLTGVALVATLIAVATVELVRFWRRSAGSGSAPLPWAAVTAPLISAVGTAGYMFWANTQTRRAGGYFAIQDQGWGSGWDWGRSTVDWIGKHATAGFGDPTASGYTISIWSMIVTAVLCLAALVPTIRGRLPWQVWLSASGIAAIVLGSGGIMHSRPRLLMFPASLIVLCTVAQALAAATRATGWRRWAVFASALAGTTAWCALGIWVSTTMLIDFDYGI